MKPLLKSDSRNVILVLTSLPDRASAETLAQHLVSQKFAACVNILTPCTSIYHWQGKIESSAETPLLIKTTAVRYTDIEAAICKMHPYELPEVLCVSADGGLDAYLQWVTSITSQEFSLE